MDTIRLSEYCDHVLDLQHAKLSDEYFYQSLPLCVIDAVFSLGVKYQGTRQTVIRYCNYYDLRRIRADKESTSITEQESIKQFTDKVESAGIEVFSDKVFDNRQRTSSKNGILKTEAVLKFAKALQKYGVNYLQDVPMLLNNSKFEESIRTIPGQKSGISLKYFFMLSGLEDIIKPDRHIKAFIKDAIKIDTEIHEAQILLSNTCEKLKVKYPHLTPRLLDNKIWEYQRVEGKKKAGKLLTQDENVARWEKNLYQKMPCYIVRKKPAGEILAHSGSIKMRHTFNDVWDHLDNEGSVSLKTSTGKKFEARAGISNNEKSVIKFFQEGKEYARAYECCWGYYYNHSRTRFGMYAKVLDEYLDKYYGLE